MLSRRSFFKTAVGAAVAVGTGAVSAPAVEASVGIDMAAVGADRSALWPLDDWANDNYHPHTVLMSREQFEQLTAPANDLTREQYAANLPVIGRDALPADKPVPRACKPGAPAKETQEQYRRRVGTKCPGMLE